MTRLALFSLSACALLLLPTTALTAVPSTIHYQGMLTTAAGDPIHCPDPNDLQKGCPSGVINMVFRIYDNPVGGDPVWTETHSSVPVVNGVVNLDLGTKSPVSPNLVSGDLYLGIELNNTGEMSPRQKIVASAFAVRAAEADSVAGINAADIVTAGNVAGYCVTEENLADALANANYLNEDALGVYLTENGYKPGGGLAGLQCLNGQVAVYNDGDWECGNSGLAPDGIAQVSNGLMSNQFVDAFTSDNVPVSIKDFYPPGVQDVIEVPDIGVGQSMKVCINVSNSFTPNVQITLKDPTGAQYSLYDGQELIGGLSACYPDDAEAKPIGNAPPFTDWFNKNPQGFWSLQVIDQGFNDVEFDGAIESWSVQMQTLSNKKIQATNDLIVQGNAFINGAIKTENDNNEVLVDGDLKVTGKITGPVFGTMGDLDNVACDDNMKGQLRNYKGIFQWCNGNVWTKMNGATFRWTKWATYNQPQGWFLDNRTDMMAGQHPSKWGDGSACAHTMSSDFDLLRQFFTRSGPAIGTLKNANVYMHRHEYTHSSTNSQQTAALFRIHNSTDQDIVWNAKWYGTGYAGWGEYLSVALNGQNIWCPGGNYYASDNHSLNLTIPANRTSTAIFVSSGTPSSTSRSVVLYFEGDSLVLPDGLEFVDDFDVKPNGWDN